MCGRFTVSINAEELTEHLIKYYNIDQFTVDIILPKYNVAPGQQVISIINDGTNNRAGLLRWGFVPCFAKDESMAFTMINAKSETLIEKTSYVSAFKNNRCIILANSFFEWKKDEQGKIPMRVLLKDNSIFPMAGIYSTYTRQDGTKLHTCAIITTQANSLVSSIHDRMPVILNKEDAKIWLDPKIHDLQYLSRMLVPYESSNTMIYQVSTLVNNAKNDFPECIINIKLHPECILKI